MSGPGGRWIFGLALSLSLALFPALLAAQPQPDLGTDAERELGQEVYSKWCAQCHGDAGDGNGIAKPFLLPAPRDFTSGKYQIRSTPTGYLPTDADITRVVRRGIPGTAMPAFAELEDREVEGLVAYLKTFSEDFADPDAYAEPIPIPDPPAFDPSTVEQARAVYREIGCARCHGESGRGDGPSAPTLRDDWGQQIRPADLTRPWTFNGGATRQDIFRSISTGLNGTPMAGFADGLTVEQRWQIVDFIQSISDGKTEAGYANLATAKAVDGEIDLDAVDELFADAPRALFPVLGQIIQPGRDFHPAVVAVEVQAVYNRDDVAVRVVWHDIQANTHGTNAPDIQVPPEEVLPSSSGATGEEDAGAEGGGFWGDAETLADGGEADEGGFWGDAATVAEEEPSDGGDFWGEAEAEPEPESDSEGGGFWDTGEEAAAPAGAVADTSEWSDAIAIQLPKTMPEGVRKPYFLFGDAQKPVDLWYVDLSRPDTATLWEGRGGKDVQATDDSPPDVRATYQDGQWVVTFVRRRSGPGIPFDEGTFVPIAFSVWDGFAAERGTKRGLTAWFDLYVPPLEKPSPWRPVARTAGLAFGLELLVIGAVRWRRRKSSADRPDTD